MVAVAENQTLYRESFDQLNARIADEPAWLGARRRAAIERFTEAGLPTPRDEDWKYTNLAGIRSGEFVPAESPIAAVTAGDIGSVGFEEIDAHRVVFINGEFAPELSRLEACSVEVGGLLEKSDDPLVAAHLARQTDALGNSLAALNTAFFTDGAYVHVPERVVEKKPVHLVWVTAAEQAGRFTHPRTLIVADRESQATVIETFVGLGDSYWTNAVTEVVVAENARIEHYKLQQEHVAAHHTGFLFVDQARDSNFASHSLSFGGRLVRSDAHVRLGGEGGECTLNGLYAVTGEQHIDHHTTIDHAEPHCNSHQLYRGVLDGQSTGVFNGKIIVRQDAQKTDAVQRNKNLLLSRKAEVNTKPQLQIDANDVRCTHGATVGQIDAEAMFYLRSRGIGWADARSLLIYGFAADILEGLNVDGWREPLQTLLLDWVKQAETDQ